MNTTLLFLKSYLSRDQFQEALAWIKAREKRLFLAESKLWAWDTETTPTDPSWEQVKAEAEEAGWTIVGSTFWDPSMTLRGNEKALEGLAELSVARENRGSRRAS